MLILVRSHGRGDAPIIVVALIVVMQLDLVLQRLHATQLKPGARCCNSGISRLPPLHRHPEAVGFGLGIGFRIRLGHLAAHPDFCGQTLGFDIQLPVRSLPLLQFQQVSPPIIELSSASRLTSLYGSLPALR